MAASSDEEDEDPFFVDEGDGPLAIVGIAATQGNAEDWSNEFYGAELEEEGREPLSSSLQARIQRAATERDLELAISSPRGGPPQSINRHVDAVRQLTSPRGGAAPAPRIVQDPAARVSGGDGTSTAGGGDSEEEDWDVELEEEAKVEKGTASRVESTGAFQSMLSDFRSLVARSRAPDQGSAEDALVGGAGGDEDPEVPSMHAFSSLVTSSEALVRPPPSALRYRPRPGLPHRRSHPCPHARRLRRSTRSYASRRPRRRAPKPQSWGSAR